MSKYILEVSPLRNNTGIVGFAPFVRNVDGHDPKTHIGVCAECVGWSGWAEHPLQSKSGTIFSTEAEAAAAGEKFIAGTRFAQ